MSIGQVVTKGERWSLFSAALSNAGQLLLLLALARLVSREAFAVMAVAGAAAGLPQLILQTGLSHSLFSRAQDSQEQLSTLFWLHLIFSLTLGGILVLAAFPLSWFYGGLFLKEAVWLLSAALAFGAVAALYRTLLLKALHYAFLARVALLVFVSSAALALVLAIQGAGVFALLAQVVFRSILECLLLFWKGRHFFSPSFQFRLASIKGHLDFASGHIGERMSMWLSAQADVLLIGKLLGMEILGVYEVFRRLLYRPPAVLGEIMERLALPLMARYKNRPLILKRIYLNNIRLILTVVFPVYGVLALFSEKIISILFEPVWQPYAPTFSFVALAVSFQAIGHPVDNLLVARGTIRRLLVWNMAFFPVYLALIWLGSARGLWGITLLLFLSAVFISNPAYFFLVRSEMPVSAREYAYPLFRVLRMVLLSGLLPGMLLFFSVQWWAWLWAGVLFILVYSLLTRRFLPDIWLWIVKIASLSN